MSSFSRSDSVRRRKAKASIAPGETKRVTVSLDARSFSYWDEAKHGWTIDPGKFVIHVGDSSENTPLHADLTIN
jgi:beta-glucosidase